MPPRDPKFIGMLRELRPHLEKIGDIIEKHYPDGPPDPVDAGLPATFLEQLDEDGLSTLSTFLEGSGMTAAIHAVAVYDGEDAGDA
jgi:hypothetical protein